LQIGPLEILNPVTSGADFFDQLDARFTHQLVNVHNKNPFELSEAGHEKENQTRGRQ